MSPAVDRRQLLLSTGVALGAAVVARSPARSLAAETAPAAAAVGGSPFGYCLNTSTIRGQKLPLVREIEIAAQAGYTGIEPWMREIEEYLKTGGTLADLRKRIADAGLKVASAIGFAEWIVDDDAQRARGLEQARHDMDIIAQLGGAFIAAPPAGATKQVGLDLNQAAIRYRALCELGTKMGVRPQVEVWGHSTTLGRLSESTFVAIEAGHPAACLLPDVYHLFKGGSSFEGLKMLGGPGIHCFHVNDYPAQPPRAEMTDAHRVFPGDGVAPLDALFRTLRDAGFRGMLSLELFNREYWERDALEVARVGLEKTKAAVARALGSA